MTMTLSPSTVAKWEKDTGMPTQDIHLMGFLDVDGDSLRLVDPERQDFKIDIVDPRFLEPKLLGGWPLNPNAHFWICVDIEWVLSTVRICRVNHLTVHFPIDEPNGVACLWPPDRPVGRVE